MDGSDEPNNKTNEHHESGQDSIEDLRNEPSNDPSKICNDPSDLCNDPSKICAYMPPSKALDYDNLEDRQIQEWLEKPGQSSKQVLSNSEHRTAVECFASDEDSTESVVYGSSDESNNGIGSFRYTLPISDRRIHEQSFSFRRRVGFTNENSLVSSIFKLPRAKHKNSVDITKISKNEKSIKESEWPQSLNVSREKSSSNDRTFLPEDLEIFNDENLFDFKLSHKKETTQLNSVGPVIANNSVSSDVEWKKSPNDRRFIAGPSSYDGQYTLTTSKTLKYHNQEVLVGESYEETVRNLNQAILNIDVNMNSSSNDSVPVSSDLSLQRVHVSDFDSSEESKSLSDMHQDVQLLSDPDSSGDNIENLSKSSENVDLSRRPISESSCSTKKYKTPEFPGLIVSRKRAYNDYRYNTSLSKASSTSELCSTFKDNEHHIKEMPFSNLLAFPHRKFRSTNLAPITEVNFSSNFKTPQIKKSHSLELTEYNVQNVHECLQLDTSVSPSHQRKQTKGFSGLGLSNSLNCVTDDFDLSPTPSSRYTQRKYNSFHTLNFSDSSSDEITSKYSREKRERRKRKKKTYRLPDINHLTSNSKLYSKANAEDILSLADSNQPLKRVDSTKSIKIESDPLSIIHESNTSMNFEAETSEDNRTSRKRLVSQSETLEMETSEGKENKKFKRTRSVEK